LAGPERAYFTDPSALGALQSESLVDRDLRPLAIWQSVTEPTVRQDENARLIFGALV
jgi:hypothetical protein